MKISELKPRQSGVNVEATVVEIEEPRSFSRYGRYVRVTNAIIDDGSGKIKLTLWNRDIDRVKVGDTIRVVNGYVNMFRDEKQLTAGKFGKLEVVKKETKTKTEEPVKETAEEDKELEKSKEAEENLAEEAE